MSVAVPPIFEAITSDIKNGNGSNSSSSAINRVTGTKSSTVVTLSRMAESNAVIQVKKMRIRKGFPFASLQTLLPETEINPFCLRC